MLMRCCLTKRIPKGLPAHGLRFLRKPPIIDELERIRLVLTRLTGNLPTIPRSRKHNVGLTSEGAKEPVNLIPGVRPKGECDGLAKLA
jgi:hypothetical protein